MGSSHEQSRKNLYLFILVVVPFFGRFVIDFVLQVCKAKISKFFKGQNPVQEAIFPVSKPEDFDVSATEQCAQFTVNSCDSPDIRDSKVKLNKMMSDNKLQDPRDLVCTAAHLKQLNIAEICLCMGWTVCTGYAVLFIRLLFWHWMQPVMYCWALYAFSDEISSVQLGLGCVVAVREAFYALITLYCIFYHQQVFLINFTRKTLVEEKEELKGTLLFLYFVMPEKFLILFIVGGFSDVTDANGDSDVKFVGRRANLFFVYFDVMAVVALLHGLIKHNLPYPLAIGYGVVSLSGVFMIIVCFYGCVNNIYINLNL
ncbi:MAG: hypothetical protein EOP48_21825 [Sphingobacteriales bacterium]|nr:MAG: hypothetical protein EOP48_21825 [Sphingobacteriales bacterium]